MTTNVLEELHNALQVRRENAHRRYWETVTALAAGTSQLVPEDIEAVIGAAAVPLATFERHVAQLREMSAAAQRATELRRKTDNRSLLDAQKLEQRASQLRAELTLAVFGKEACDAAEQLRRDLGDATAAVRAKMAGLKTLAASIEFTAGEAAKFGDYRSRRDIASSEAQMLDSLRAEHKRGEQIELPRARQRLAELKAAVEGNAVLAYLAGAPFVTQLQPGLHGPRP